MLTDDYNVKVKWKQYKDEYVTDKVSVISKAQ